MNSIQFLYSIFGNIKQISDAPHPYIKEVIPLSASAVSRTLRVSVHGEPIELPADDILFIEVFNWKCTIHRCAGAPISINVPLKTLAETLVSPSFIRCGRSFLVNLNHLTAVSSDSLILRSGRSIPVPRRARAALIPYCSRFLPPEP